MEPARPRAVLPPARLDPARHLPVPPLPQPAGQKAPSLTGIVGRALRLSLISDPRDECTRPLTHCHPEPPKDGEGPRRLIRRRLVHLHVRSARSFAALPLAQDDKRGSVLSAFELRAKTWNWLIYSEQPDAVAHNGQLERSPCKPKRRFACPSQPNCRAGASPAFVALQPLRVRLAFASSRSAEEPFENRILQ